MEKLWISEKSKSNVLKVLEDCDCTVKNNIEYDPNSCYENNGAYPFIIYEKISNGISYPQITSPVNVKRCADKLQF